MANEAVLRRCFRCQPERGGKAFWDAQQLDCDLASRWIPRIASEARLSTKGESAHAARGKGSHPVVATRFSRNQNETSVLA